MSSIKKLTTSTTSEVKREGKSPTLKKEQITLSKINDAVVKPIKTSKDKETRLPKGYKLFPEPYPNIGIIAKKQSGKTNVVVNIVKACADKDSSVVVLASTAHKDPMFGELKRWCRKFDIPYEALTEIRSVDEAGRKSDFFDQFMKQVCVEEEDVSSSGSDSEEEKRMSNYGQLAVKQGMKEDSESDYSSDEDDDINFGKRHDKSKAIFAKNKGSLQPKKPYITPEFILICDDISNELKLPSLRSFFKRNRHMRAMDIISTQWLQDLLPESLKQFDYLLLFKGLTDVKLEKVKNDADLSIPFEKLQAIYKDACKEKFCFLYIDTRNEIYRKNFNMRYNVIIDD
jgi:hypothetical protein